MTIDTQVNEAGPYLGNDTTDTYAYGFKIIAEDQLRVIYTPVGSPYEILELNVDYTVTGVGNDGGGNVVLSSGNLANNEELYIVRIPDFLQDTDYDNQGSYLPQTHEDSFDLLMMCCQYLLRQYTYALTLDPNVDAGSVNFSFPASSADGLFKWAADGLSIEYIDLADFVLESEVDFDDFVSYTDGLTGQLNGNGQILQDMIFQNYAEKSTAPVSAAGALALNLTNGTVFDVTLTEDTDITFSNMVVGPNVSKVDLILTQDGTGGWDATFPASVVWDGGYTPNLDTDAGAVNILTFFTNDGGTTWYGFHVGRTMSAGAGAFTGEAINEVDSANGFFKLSGGLIFQWGSEVVAANDGVTVNFNEPFVSGVQSAHATANTITDTVSDLADVGCDTIGLTSMRVYNETTKSKTVSWFVIGV